MKKPRKGSKMESAIRIEGPPLLEVGDKVRWKGSGYFQGWKVLPGEGKVLAVNANWNCFTYTIEITSEHYGDKRLSGRKAYITKQHLGPGKTFQKIEDQPRGE